MKHPDKELPTPAHAVIQDWLQQLLHVMPAYIDSVFIIGSLSLNDFQPGKSDIDFVVVCSVPVSHLNMNDLMSVHRLLAKRFSIKLNGVYIDHEIIGSDTPQNKQAITYQDSALKYNTFNMAPVTLYELNYNALIVYGRPLVKSSIKIDNDKLFQFLYTNINSYWRSWICRHPFINRHKLLLFLFPRITEWVLLGIARQFYTLRTGEITSKSNAAHYCLQELPERFHPILDRALAIRKNRRTNFLFGSYALQPSRRRFIETIECANFLVALFNDYYTVKI